MDIRPSIIGPDLSINPDLVMIPFERVEFPMPGLMVSTRDLVLLMGDNQEVGLSLDLCRNLQMQGSTGKGETDLFCRFEDGQYRVKGLFGQNYCEYSIIPLQDGSYRMTGDVAGGTFNLRVFSSPSLCTMNGTIRGVPVEYKLDTLSQDSYAVKGKEGDKELDVRIFYKEEGIRIQGNHGGIFVEYTVASTGEQIEMKGITKNKFSSMNFVLEDETQLHITGKPFHLPVDYRINLYDNGVAFSGNTGVTNIEYGFVIDTGEEGDQ